jgi:hypothetical protein
MFACFLDITGNCSCAIAFWANIVKKKKQKKKANANPAAGKAQGIPGAQTRHRPCLFA